MLILAVDTALAACSAGLYDTASGAVIGERMEPMARGHAERLAPMVDAMMRQAGTAFSDIERIAVSTGPGTFTGVRIGIAFARGLSLALGCPAVGVSTLEALAAGVQQQAAGRPIAAIIDARREAVYVQVFSADLQPERAPQAVLLADLAALLPDGDVLAVGSGAALAARSCKGIDVAGRGELPHPHVVAQLAARKQPGAAPPRPLYLRPPDAKQQARALKFKPARVTIAEAGSGHGEVLAAIHAECLPKPWNAREIAQLSAMPGTRVHLACQAGEDLQPLGFVMVRQAADEAEIIMLATRPAARRRRVATSLLGHVVEVLKAGGCTTLHLEVDENNVSARAFYGAAGFSEVGRRKGYYGHPDGTRSDAVLMQIPL